MATTDRRRDANQERPAQIVATARALAESEGWPAVTTRRLSQEIGYSQPVLYTHFRGMQQIVDAVAAQGFTELASDVADAVGRVDSDVNAVSGVNHARSDNHDAARLRAALSAYLTFATRHRAVFEAMFDTSGLVFGDDAGPEQRAAFEALHRVIRPVASSRGFDSETLTEVAWSAAHGLAVLGAGQRLRPAADEQRLSLLVSVLVGD